MKTRRFVDRYPEAEAWTDETTVVGAGIVFDGEIETDGTVVVAGRVRGPLRSGALVMVTAGGVVQGNVSARSMVVEGAVEGDITVKENFELRPSGRVRGDLAGPYVAMAEGAYLKGRIHAEHTRVHRFRERRHGSG